MKEITERTLFGFLLKGIDGEDTLVRIEEASGEVTEGKVIGYSRGGYIVNGEIIQAAVQILTEQYTCRIVIDNIKKICIG